MSLATDNPGSADVGNQGSAGLGSVTMARSPGVSSIEGFADVNTPQDRLSLASQTSESNDPQQDSPWGTKVGNPIDGIALPDRPKHVYPSMPKPAPQPGTATPTEPRPDKPRFLIVDDNPLNLKILASYVKKLGRLFDSATDGKQAVESFQKSAGSINCILMDISMPVMDGFEATRRIRTHEKALGLPRCSILALTGLASASAQQEAFASGIDLFLTKPVRLKELSKILETRGIR